MASTDTTQGRIQGEYQEWIQECFRLKLKSSTSSCPKGNLYLFTA